MSGKDKQGADASAAGGPADGSEKKRRGGKRSLIRDGKAIPAPAPALKSKIKNQKSKIQAPLHELPIEWVQLSAVNPAPYNPRADLQPGDPEYDKLEREMLQFGFAGGMVFNRRTGNLVGGHQRVKILVAHKKTRVQMAVCDLSLDEEKVFNVALNKTGGAWDQAGLASLLKEIQESGAVDATLTGLDAGELTRIVEEGHELVTRLVGPPPEDEDGDQGEGGGEGGDGIASSWEVVVNCKDEKHQQRVFKRNMAAKEQGEKISPRTMY